MDWRIFYNPLAVFGTRGGLVVAILVVAVLTAVAYWGGVHLDGALDLHINPQFPSLALVAIESLSAWLCLGLILFAASKVFGGNGGVGSHLASAGLARFPYILLAIVASRQVLGQALLKAVRMSRGEMIVNLAVLRSPAYIGCLITAAITFAWMMAMLASGYNQASRLPIAKMIASWVVGVVAAWAVSKAILLLAFNAGL